MRAVVVGAGAWGLPAAAELARRGHAVTLVEAHDVGHQLGSSGGASRIWRLSHADPLMVRLALRSVEAWRRLEARTGTTLLLRRGLLWRERPGQVAAALDASGVRYQEVASPEVGRWFPGLRPNGVDAVWQGDAGPVLAAYRRLERALAESGRGRQPSETLAELARRLPPSGSSALRTLELECYGPVGAPPDEARVAVETFDDLTRALAEVTHQ